MSKRSEWLRPPDVSVQIRPALRVLDQSNRTAIVQALDMHGPLSVGLIAATLRISKSLTSQHLKVLFDEGVLRRRRHGRVIVYSLCRSTLVALVLQLIHVRQA